jgi:predicted HTH domain antitoxin
MARLGVMQDTIVLDCPEEMLPGLHVNAGGFRDEVKRQAAFALFREGRLSSGMAARWLGIPRIRFLMLAMRAGAELAGDTQDDFNRELALL